MTDAVAISLINTAGLVLVGIGVALINKQQKVISNQINGQQELLLKATGDKERAEGKEEGKKEQRDDGKETAKEVIKQIQEDDDITITKK
ncbi:MAG: hypothetical protein V4547_16855 [Bacteroidota bacterium]